jgi:arginyl-tRNA synthetase
MNLNAHFAHAIEVALTALKAEGGLPADLEVKVIGIEPTRDASHGDLASNVALALSKQAKMKPRDLAEKISVKLAGNADIAKVEVAGPGFINLTIAPRLWHEIVRTILAAGARYGRSDLGQGAPINVEYVSANPTGPMHVGHCRGAVFGDALANLLDYAGYKVTREYYINDAGAQVDVLARSAFLRYREALGETIEIPSGLYPGDYLKPVGAALAATHGDKLKSLPEKEWLGIVRAKAIEMMLAAIKGDLATLAIQHDLFFSEASLTGGGKDEIADTIADLRARGLIYQGRLEPPKGEKNDDWEDREQTLFKATDYGDDVDRALVKADGSYTYFAADMAYHRTKLKRGFRQLINVWGADHKGYIKRMQAAVDALSGGAMKLEVKVSEMVNLLRDGQPVKMSKRAGTFETLRDVVDEVGRDPVRYMMIYRSPEMKLDFDFAKVTEQSKDNPVFYVQYAHARCASVFRQAAEALPGLDLGAAKAADLSMLIDPGEVELIKRLAGFPRLIETAAREHEPHRVAFYLYELAGLFHGQWTRGNDSPHLRFIQAGDRASTAARLALVGATQQVIACGLGVLGVQAPLEMR